MSDKHPANRGLVMLMVWVEPHLRDLVRARASDEHVSVSDWVAEALRRQGLDEDLMRIRRKIERDQT